MKHKFALSLFALGLSFGISAGEPIIIKAADFVREHAYTWPDNKYGSCAEAVKKSGNLGSLPGEGTKGFFEYDFQIPADGFYRIESNPKNIPWSFLIETTLDGKFYAISKTPVKDKKQQKDINVLGNFRLAKGKHTLRIELRALYRAFGKYTGFTISETAPDQRIRIETLLPFSREIVIRKGADLPFEVLYSDLEKASKMEVSLTDFKTGELKEKMYFDVPASREYKKIKIEMPVKNAGIYKLKFTLPGKTISDLNVIPYSVVAIDTTPLKPTLKMPELELVQVIDCVKQKPDYAKGVNKVVTSEAGTFRESSPYSGWDCGIPGWESSNMDEFFAYKLTGLEPEKLYRVEFEFPNDTARASHFAVRGLTGGYSKVLGMNSGREFRTDGKMHTAALYCWFHDKEARIVIIPGGNHMPAAISKVRVYKVKGNQLYPLDAARPGFRKLQYFYEEAPSVIGTETGKRYNNNVGGYMPETICTAVDRFCQKASFFGATEHLYTPEIYGGGFWPSKYQCCRWTRPYCSDNLAKFLLIAEKYGMNCVFDFHCSPLDFHKTEGEWYSPENGLCNMSGEKKMWNDLGYLLNPIHPDTCRWRREMLTDFINRYKGYPAFKGIRLRNMHWVDAGTTTFHDLNQGYDDYTIAQFTKETGIKVPGDLKDPKRFGKRYNFLTQQKKSEWIAWRVKKVTEIHTEVLKLLKSIRPDLRLYGNLDGGRDIEGGYDRDALQKAGIPVSLRTNTSRLPSRGTAPRVSNLQTFDLPEDPATVESSMMHWLDYYEGPKIALNEEIGLPKNPINWWGYAAWPAARNELELWALGVARRDVAIFTTGTISYGFGTELMREFMAEFNELPAKRFHTITKDPVAVRTYEKYLYAVNSLPVNVKVSIKLSGNGKAKRLVGGQEMNLNSFELKPFQLMSFTTDNKVESVKVQPDPEYVNDLENMASVVIAAGKKKNELKSVSEALQKCLDAKEYCKLKMLLEINVKLITAEGVPLPGLYSQAASTVPAGALTKADGGKTVKGKDVHKFWKDETLYCGKKLTYQFEAVFSGKIRPVIGAFGGTKFDRIDIYFDGKKLSTVNNAGGNPYFFELPSSRMAEVAPGKHIIELRSAGEKDICVFYVDPVWDFYAVPARFYQIGACHKPEPNQSMEKAFAQTIPGDTNRKFYDTKTHYWKQGKGGTYPIVLGPADEGYRCAVTYVYSPKEQTIRMKVRADWFWKFMLNGTVVTPFDCGGSLSESQRKFFDLKLQKGWNELFFKVGAGSQGFKLFMAITEPYGLRFSAHGPYPKFSK